MHRRLTFQPFNERSAVRIVEGGFLPHWTQPGCTYFVTFRLADAIPSAVMNQWKYERITWLRSRIRRAEKLTVAEALQRLSPRDCNLFRRFFLGRYLQYLDAGYGTCVLERRKVSCLMVNAMKYFDLSRFDAGDFVIMPNHVHALMTPYSGFELEQIIHSIKSYTAKRINRILGRDGQLWMDEYYDHLVRDREELARFQAYIRGNPEKANLSRERCPVYEVDYELGENDY